MPLGSYGNEQAIMGLLNSQGPEQQQMGLGRRIMGAAAPLLGNQDFALALLANSGYSPNKRSFGQIVGQSALQSQDMKAQREHQGLQRQLMQAQIGALGGKGQGPSSVQEYEYAKRNGYKGTFQEWVVAGGQSSRPSAVQEWEFYNNLLDKEPEKARQYLEMKRNPNFMVKDINQVPNLIAPGVAGGSRVSPLSTLPQTTAAAEAVKQAEGRGGALGKTQGDITGEIQKKGSNSATVIGLTDEAEKLLKTATGSMAGTGLDKGAAFFGISTEGARSTARLKVIQAGLMMNQPRMEGPQGEKDVELYQQAAAQVGDSTVPTETRMAALTTIRDLQKKYAERAESSKRQGSETAAERAARLGL